MSLQGGPELKARLKAIRLAFKPIGKDWADETAKIARGMVPVRTGRLRQSIKRRNATQKRATVVAHHTAYFVDKGPKPHLIKPRRGSHLIFQAGGRTIFARQVNHRGYRGRPFRARAAQAGLRRTDLDGKLIAEWNRAA